MRVEKTFLMMREAPLGHDRTATRDDAGGATRGERNVSEQYAGVHGEVIDPLLCLFDERVTINLPGQFFGAAANFFERLINRHCADGHGRIANDPFPRGMDVFAGAKVHDRVRAPFRRPAHLLDFFLDRRRDGAVANVGVNFYQEIAPDDHRLGLRMIDVRRDYCAATSYLSPHVFRRYFVRDICTERVSTVLMSAGVAG